MYRNLAIFSVFAFLYSIVSGRLEKTPITAPIIYILSGLTIGSAGLNILEFDISSTDLRYITDITPTLVLSIK